MSPKLKSEAEEILLSIVSERDNKNYNYPTRKAAVDGLVVLQSVSSIGKLESLRPLFSNQDQPWLTRKINSIKESQKDDNTSLKKEIISLKDRISKLETKVLNDN